jgi:hypothetical protein
MARLAALVPPPRMHLTRYHGVFAPHSSLRAAITPAQRGKGKKLARAATDGESRVDSDEPFDGSMAQCCRPPKYFISLQVSDEPAVRAWFRISGVGRTKSQQQCPAL